MDARGRLTRLIKYTSGDAKELIKHCIHRPAHEGYEEAKQLLKERYGKRIYHTCCVQERPSWLAEPKT